MNINDFFRSLQSREEYFEIQNESCTSIFPLRSVDRRVSAKRKMIVGSLIYNEPIEEDSIRYNSIDDSPYLYD